MDELFQLVIFIIILALALLSGRRKRQPSARPRADIPRSAPRRTAARRSAMPAGSPSTTAIGTRRPASPPGRRKTLEETLLDLLGQQLPEPMQPPEPGGQATEVVPVRETLPEAWTHESVEISPEARHAQFHERYLDAAPPPKAAETPRLRLSANPRSLREAVIWKTVLGRPKGLEL